MKKQLIYLLGILILAASCDATFSLKGKILDESNNKPLNGVKITSSEGLITYSDSLGNFKFHRFGPMPMSDKLELLIEKEGYETKYIDLSKVSDMQNVTLNVRPSKKIQTTYYSKSLVKFFYFINLFLINLMILLTLIFIMTKGVKYKWIWILLILILNITFRINYINGLYDINFFHLLFFLKHYEFYPFTIKIVLPISLILFWSLYFLRRESIIKIEN